MTPWSVGVHDTGMSKDRIENPTMSLEQAHARYVAGLLDAKSAYWFSIVAQCECGNAKDTMCWQTRHVEMRDTLKYALEQEPYQYDERAFIACDVCACIGCSEGNCCEHEHI